MDVLSLVEDDLLPAAGLQSLSLNNNVLSLVLTGLSLEQTSEMVDTLSEDPRVESAHVSSVNTTDENLSQISMTITLLAGEELTK